MNAERLLALFDQIADAPDAVARLRQLVLDLAVRGKLVEQDPKDEPASALVQKLKQVAIGGAKRQKGATILPPIAVEDEPFEVPSGWGWERLGNLGETNIGLTYSPQDLSNDGIPVLRAGNILNGKLDLSDLVRVDFEPKNSVLVQEGDLLICARSGSRSLVGKVALIRDLPEKAAFGAFMAIFRSEVNRYLYHFICSPLFRQVIDEVNTTTINQITQNNLRSTLAPIPPLAEQHRIVAKVDELMALCDRLESAQAERESRRDRLVSASLHRLNQPAEDATAFRDDARFALDHLARFTTRPEHIPQLRQTILNLAVRGRLVPQDPKEGTTSALLKYVQAARVSAADESKKALAPLSDNVLKGEFLFDIPSTWEWVRAADLCSCIMSGSTPPQEIFDSTTGVPFLKVYNIREQRIDFEYKQQFVGHSYHSTKLKRSILRPGDVVMNIVGPPLGKTAIIPDSYPEWNCNQAITAFRPALPGMSAYLYAFFKEGSFLRNIELIGTAGQDNISVTKCRNIPVPLPPLAEQHRIVAKVDELMALCDRLEAQLTTTQTESRRLLDAVLHETLAG